MNNETALQMQEDFAYIIHSERGIGIETGRDKITYLYHHGGTVVEYYRDKRVEATMPKDKKYLELKAKYYDDMSSMSLFYPSGFKKQLDNSTEV